MDATMVGERGGRDGTSDKDSEMRREIGKAKEKEKWMSGRGQTHRHDRQE